MARSQGTGTPYFAAAALQGLLADQNFHLGPEDAAKKAVEYADALVKAL